MMASDPIDDYSSLSDQFLTHWAQVNTALAPRVLTLSGGYTRANLQADRDSFVALLATLIDADNTVQGVRARQKTEQNALKERLRQFRNAVLSQLPGSEAAAQLPVIPTTTSATSHWAKAFTDMASIWQKLEAAPPAGFTGPLLLADGYTRAQFVTELAALKATYTALTAAEGSATLQRKTRNTQAKALRTRFVAYRKAVVGAFTTGHPLLESLPSL
jgi:hypothetical protein